MFAHEIKGAKEEEEQVGMIWMDGGWIRKGNDSLQLPFPFLVD